MSVKSKKAAQSEATREALISAARRLFAERGFAGTGTEDIVATAGVTRGALYHQFKDKRELFDAVFCALEADLVGGIAAELAGVPDPIDALVRGIDLFLDGCLDPEVQQISLVDAPSVLGWSRWRDIEAEYGLGLIRAALQAAVDAGRIEPQPIEPLGHLMLGAMREAAMVLASAEDRVSTREQLSRTLTAMLRGLSKG